MPLQLAFAGSTQFSVDLLQVVLDQGHEITSVLTQPDRPAGRGRRVRPSIVKRTALENGLPVYEPPGLKDFSPSQLPVRPDFLLVVAYGLLLPKRWLEWPKQASLNVHASLLPRWRGAAPVERAILAGDKKTGTCIMVMEKGLDTGPVLATSSCCIDERETAVSLTQKISALSCELLDALLADYVQTGRLPKARPQPVAGATYASRIRRADALIDWSSSALSIDRRIRALAGRFGGITFIEGGERLVIEAAAESRLADTFDRPPGTLVSADKEGIRVQCGTGLLELLQMRLPGRGKGSVLTCRDVLNGFGELFRPGTLLTHSSGKAA